MKSNFDLLDSIKGSSDSSDSSSSSGSSDTSKKLPGLSYTSDGPEGYSILEPPSLSSLSVESTPKAIKGQETPSPKTGENREKDHNDVSSGRSSDLPDTPEGSDGSPSASLDSPKDYSMPELPSSDPTPKAEEKPKTKLEIRQEREKREEERKKREEEERKERERKRREREQEIEKQKIKDDIERFSRLILPKKHQQFDQDNSR